MSFMVKLGLVVLVLAASVALSRWVPSHRRWRPLVVILNLAITIRDLCWRGTETLNWESPWGIAVSLAVFLAEIYGFIVVLHHYIISTRATHRQAPALAETFRPSVDVFITTYNEEIDILYRTIVGCQAMEHDGKRIVVLDDGRRKEVVDLCHRLGVAYLIRDDNAGAKAGNLNNGLAHSTADLVVTFDADHVPVRTFLTETVGFFQNPEVAQVQTPHHFYNPDLFQDRLRIREYIANEQDMFYHVVQPGRDVYNSSFYCGSGAVFRRCTCGGFLSGSGFDVETGRWRRKLALMTSSMVSTNVSWMPRSRCFGMSSMSFLLRSGRSTVPTFARLAARIFSFRPPMGRTRPRSVTSPVMATSQRTGIFDKAEAIAVAMVMPAEGPSFGIAPAGT